MSAAETKQLVEIDEQGVRGWLHVASGATDGLVLTHGAGANCRSPLLRVLAAALCEAGVTVLRYDLPFRQERPKGPPLRSAERDRQGIALAVEWMRRKVAGGVFAGGHSYGGRQTSMIAAERPELTAGLLLLSYPLHPPQAPQQMRTGHFPKLQTPSLFVRGRRDGFATEDELIAAMKLIPAATRVVEIAGAGHELLSKKNEEFVKQAVVTSFREMFLRG
jgi:predicted alpha/beta-hydrolase family hydrolase